MAIKRKVNLQIIVLSTHINLHSVFYANLLQLVSVTGMLWSGLFFFYSYGLAYLLYCLFTIS